MTLPAHVTGRYCLTGFLSSMIFGINISMSWQTIVVCMIASLFPDIDNPKSLIGFLFYPISKYLYSRVGHRTITHSLVFMGITYVGIAFVEQTFTGAKLYCHIWVLALFVHVLLDSFTVMGVQLLYPFNDKTVWFSENPRWQFRTADLKVELAFIILFIAMIAPQRNLWEKGFWTSYNQSFSSPMHLFSEFQKSKDVLEVEYQTKVGTEIVEGKGFVIATDGTKTTVLENGKFRTIGEDVEMILRTKPIHTGMDMKFEESFFYGVSADSLNFILNGKKIWELNIEANQKFITNHFGSVNKLAKSQITDLFIQEFSKEVELERFEPKRSPRIESIRKRIGIINRDYQKSKKAFQVVLGRIAELESKIELENEVVKRYELESELEELRKEKSPIDVSVKISDLENEIRELEQKDKFENLEKSNEVRQRNESKRIEPLRLNGRIVEIVLH